MSYDVKIIMVNNLVATMKKLKKDGFFIYAASMEGEDFRKIDYSTKRALVIGNEGSGMTRLTTEKCDFIAKIPMYGETNSLNASVATGIMIYEVLRQKGK